MALDLTPFGFTPTESLAYSALLALGPSSGYAIAKEIGVARANAYQALNGLVSKDAAQLINENPLRFRAVRPEALLARISAVEADKLAELERQVREVEGVGGDAIVPLEGERGVIEVLTRAAGRAAGPVWCVAPQRLLDALQPVWRKRDADGAETRLSAAPTGDEGMPDAAALLFWCEEAAVVARASDEETSGHWFSDPLLIATVRAAIDRISQTVG